MDHFDFSLMLENYENLSDNDKQLMEAHAGGCEECRRELEFYRSIMKTTASLPVMEPPADLLDKINSRIDSMPSRTSRFGRAAEHFRIYRVQYATVAACLAVGLIVGLNSGVIRDKLDPAAPDGIISTTTRVSDRDTGKLSDYKLADDEPEATPAADERVVAEASDATVKPELAVTTPKPKAVAKSAATARPATARPAAVTAKPVTSATSSVAAARPAAAQSSSAVTTPETSAAQSAAAVTTPETPAAQSAAAVTTPETPAAPVIPTEQPTKGKYIIARGNYHIPETAQANVDTTEAPAAAADTEIAGEHYQIAMGSYELPEEERKALSSNKLIVNNSDIETIVACMNSSWIRGTNNGYTATRTAFANFLAKLDAEGVFYNYIQLSDTGSEVYFVLLAN